MRTGLTRVPCIGDGPDLSPSRSDVPHQWECKSVRQVDRMLLDRVWLMVLFQGEQIEHIEIDWLNDSCPLDLCHGEKPALTWYDPSGRTGETYVESLPQNEYRDQP